MYEIGRLCVKLVGRDSNKKCVIVELLDDVYVMIDGQTRRRKCNIRHLEPLDKVLDIKKGASHKEVVAAFKKLKIEVTETKPKPKTEKPKKTKKEKVKEEAKETVKTETKKKESKPKKTKVKEKTKKIEKK